MAKVAAVILLGLLAVVPQPSAAQSRPITKLESRRLSEGDVRKRVLAQLGDILVANRYMGRPGRKPVRPLSDLWFYTRPRATSTEGVCASEQVVFRFAPVADDTHQDAATPVSVNGIEATTRFLLLGQVDQNQVHRLSSQRRSAAEARCGALDPRAESFITAPDEETAVEGVNLTLDLVAQARRNSLNAAVTCPGAKVACTILLSPLNRDAVNSVEDCSWEARVPSQQCLLIDAGDLRIRGMIADGKLVAATIDEMIVVADERMD